MQAFIDVMSGFVNWLCYLPIFEPLFYLIGAVLNIAPQTVTRYVARAFSRNFYDALPIWTFCILLPVIVLIVLKIFGFLNLGNLPKKGRVEKKASDLNGKNTVFLGSSVTKGMAAQGRSFVDMLADAYGAKVVKEAVSGTTLVDNGARSYVSRLKKLSKDIPCDVFVCQLSTNDATKKAPLGKIADGTDMASFDTKTVCGAIEYIIAYAKATWNCPVVFYTNPQYASPAYKAMVDALAEIAKKWNIQVIDLWNDKEINEKKNKKYSFMNDQIHPTKKAYAMWTPVFEGALSAVLNGGKVPNRAKAGEVQEKTLKTKKTQRLIVRAVVVFLAVFLLFVAFLATAGIIHVIQMFGFNHPGNGPEYALKNVQVLEDSPLKGKKVLGVGSSVLAGTASKGVGPGEYFCALNGMTYTKECAVGTSVTSTDRPTLDGLGTYLPRMMDHTAEEDFDMVIIQLGTNDCADWVVVGELGDEPVSLDLADYDEYTFCGAMQSMIAYACNTWGDDTGIFIFANSTFEDKNVEKYNQMTAFTQEICDKWEAAGYNVHLIDMWNDAEFNAVPEELVELYGAGEIHPRQAGYYVWWMPFWNDYVWPLYQ